MSRAWPHVRITHSPFNFRLWRERRNGVDHHHIDSAGATIMSQISRACSPVSGWETSKSSVFTPRFSA